MDVVIPVKTGIQEQLLEKNMDSCFRRNDKKGQNRKKKMFQFPLILSDRFYPSLRKTDHS